MPAKKLAIQKINETLAVKGSAAEAAAADYVHIATFSSANGDSLHLNTESLNAISKRND